MRILPSRLQPYAVPFLAALSCLLLLYLSAPAGHNTALWLHINLLLVLVLTGLSLLLTTIRRYRTQVGIQVFALCAGAVLALALWQLDRVLLRSFLPAGHRSYLAWTENTRYVRLFIGMLLFGWMGMLSAAQRGNSVLEEKLSQQQSAATLLREAELYKLRQQLQPHFLFNSLNAISSLTMISPYKAQEMIGRLSDFLRSSVRREASALLPLEEELEYIESYLAIETIRFGDRLRVQYERKGGEGAEIPPFLLQPLVENAIKFGLYGTTGNLLISVKISAEADRLQIRITNPYDPSGQPPRGTGFGLEGVRRRLLLLYGRADLLQTEKTETHFTCILTIPQDHA